MFELELTGAGPYELRTDNERDALTYDAIAGAIADPIFGNCHELLTGTAVPVMVAVIGAVADRAELVLPGTPLAESLPYVMALAQGDVSAVLDAMVQAERLTADEATTLGDMVRKAMSGELLATDDALYVAPGPATRIAPRPDGTVKGRLGATVIGTLTPWHLTGDAAGNYGTAQAHWDAARLSVPDRRPNADERTMQRWNTAEAITRADMHLHAAGTPLHLIGTEVGSWSEVIDHKPVTVELDYLTWNGKPVGPIVFAPYGETFYPNTYGSAGSIVGSLETAKKRTGWQRTAITHSPRPTVVDDVEGWGRTGEALRIVKRYRTTAKLTANAPRSVITGHGRWAHKSPRVSIVKRDASVRTLTHAEGVELIADVMRTAMDSKQSDARVTVKTTNGYRMTAAMVRAGRKVRVTVSHAGHVVNRTVRTVSGIRTTLNRHAA